MVSINKAFGESAKSNHEFDKSNESQFGEFEKPEFVGSTKPESDELLKWKGLKPAQLVREMGLEQVSDHSELGTVVDEVIAQNPAELESYRNGKTKLFSFFMGQIMKKTKGKADPKVITQLLNEKL
ncbi:MAG: hypothetical protein HQK63_13765 [Desulfamplus sp.]|nr:hypothetical protein [Desulfamplus sp.]